MHRRSMTAVLGLLPLAAFACTRAEASRPPAYAMSASSSESAPSSASLLPTTPVPAVQPAEPDLLSVAPDRALVPVVLEAEAEGYAATSGALRAAVAQLADELTRHGQCTMRVTGYLPPHEQYGKSKSAEPADEWSAIAQLEVGIPLDGLSDVAARMGRVDACLGHLASLRASPEAALSHARWQTGALLVTLDDIDRYREPLIALRLARLRALAEQTPGAPQYHPGDLRCTSLGQVTVVARSLDAVKLGVDMQCRTPERGEEPRPTR